MATPTFALEVWQASLGQLQRQRLVHEARRDWDGIFSDFKMRSGEVLGTFLTLNIFESSFILLLVSCAARMLKRCDMV